jgi:ATP-dependent DNA helicase
LKELWSLLNFILPDIFDDLETFEKWFDFSDIHNEGGDNRLLSKEDSRSVITQLHSILKPFLLRRLKVDVESNLPPKKEYLLYAPLTALQKELYEECVHGTIRKWLLEKKTGLPYAEIRSLLGESPPVEVIESNGAQGGQNGNAESQGPAGSATRRIRARGNNVSYAEDETDDQFADRIEAGDEEEKEDAEPLSASDQEREGKLYAIKQAQKDIHNMKLQNLFMQLRKICCHPYLFDWPKQPDGQMLVDKSLVTSSGKMLMLNRLLDALFAKKHKVLIFSQFTTILDIIEDWADEYKKIKTCRIDGTTSQEDRRMQMKSFNEDTSADSVKLFLLSTRAGGLGINLVAADTVIFYDSDWNPQMDLQAQDRVHRIGQKKPVLIFRLVSANTVESRLLKRAGDKRKLEAIVIKNGEFQLPAGVSGADLLNGSAAGRSTSKGKQESMQDMARSLMALEGEKVQLAEEGDEIISDSQLEMLLDRSDAAYKRQTGWVAADASGKFEVTETNADAANEDLAKLMAEG